LTAINWGRLDDLRRVRQTLLTFVNSDFSSGWQFDA